MCKQLVFIICYFIISAFSCALALDCPSIPPVPKPSAEDLAFQNSWQEVAEPYSIRYTVRNDEEAHYGIGHLYILSDHGYIWPRDIILPLWASPNTDAFYGWAHSGRVYPDGVASAYELSGIGMVETDYESNSFIVWETFNDGWLRIKLKPAKGGDAWTHICHLEIGEAKLAFEGWESFLKKHGDWLHFRSQVPHYLREQPNEASASVTKIGLDHKLMFLEFKDDWMRVKVEQPDWTCNGASDEEFKGSIHEGWVKWRDEKIGPWVWIYTRGC